MPTVRNVPGPYRLFFYSFDCNEPKHVHVRRERMVCKFWLEPLVLSFNEEFQPAELNRICRLIVGIFSILRGIARCGRSPDRATVARSGDRPQPPRIIERIRLWSTDKGFWRLGMNTVVSDIPRITDMRVTDEVITAHLADGRTISVPLAWSWRLSEATPEQRSNFEFIGNGLGVHWPDIDEDISAAGMLSGRPARSRKASVRPRRSPRPSLKPATVPA